MDIGKIGVNTNMASSGLDSASAERAAQQAQDSEFEKLLQAAIEKKDEKGLKEACRQFEGIIIEMMYKQMKATVVKSGFLEQDPGTDIFNSMLDEKLADIASQSGGFGLAETLYKQLSRQYGISGNSGSDSGKKTGNITELEGDGVGSIE